MSCVGARTAATAPPCGAGWDGRRSRQAAGDDADREPGGANRRRQRSHRSDERFPGGEDARVPGDAPDGSRLRDHHGGALLGPPQRPADRRAVVDAERSPGRPASVGVRVSSRVALGLQPSHAADRASSRVASAPLVTEDDMPSTCRACHSTDLDVMVDFGALPLAGGFLVDEVEIAREQRYPLAVHVCNACALVQIVEPVDPDVLFQDYSFSSSTIAGLVRHFDDYAGWLVDRLEPEFVVEFGCNDGVLLQPLSERGVRSVGVDVSENITDLARQRGHDVVTAFFGPEAAEQIRSEHGRADVVTGSNVFAHNADPESILRGARILLEPGGRLCLEVMYAGDLYQQVQWDTLYHEHLTF